MTGRMYRRALPLGGGIAQGRALFMVTTMILALWICATGAPGQNTVNESNRPRPNITGVHPRPAHVIVPARSRTATLYATGEKIETQWQTVWRPMCGPHAGRLDEDKLREIAETRQARQAALFDGQENQASLDDGPMQNENQEGGIAGGGINIVFDLDGTVPAQALDAIDDAEAYLESVFEDPITITIFIDFDTLDPDVLGATGSDYTDISYNMSRNGLQDGMDDSDNILNFLPPNSKIPVRYNGNNDNITLENRVFWTIANFRSTVGAVSGIAASMTFNDNFSWDFDPTDGVSDYSFEDVLIHEVGHALGFTSGVDFRVNDMETLDIFRFQRTGGGHDYNPDNTTEFRERPRLVDYNNPNNDHIVDVITKEYRMSDGNPYQGSHFREQFDNIGLMDPALGSGESYWPDFFSGADLRMFDAIGYDR